MKNEEINDILSVAAGNKELLIDMDVETKLQLGLIIFLAIAIGAFLGVQLAEKI